MMKLLVSGLLIAGMSISNVALAQDDPEDGFFSRSWRGVKSVFGVENAEQRKQAVKNERNETSDSNPGEADGSSQSDGKKNKKAKSKGKQSSDGTFSEEEKDKLRRVLGGQHGNRDHASDDRDEQSGDRDERSDEASSDRGFGYDNKSRGKGKDKAKSKGQGKSKDHPSKGKGKHKDKPVKQKKLPKGLQMKMERGGTLPPGWERKFERGEVVSDEVYRQARPLSRSILEQIENIPGTEVIQVGDRVARVMTSTREILDVISIVTGTGAQ